MSFTTYTRVTTSAVNNITSNSATCGGIVYSDGGATVTARGVCSSITAYPTISDNHTSDGSGAGSFSSNITGLTPGIVNYVRAYATNTTGTSYGDLLQFITPGAYDAQPCPETATVTDIDNNTYNTVQIGVQCWMRENLRTTRYTNGTNIALGSTSSTSTTTAYRYYPNNDQSNVTTCGYLYNWKAVMGNSYSSSANPSGVQGICPTGWHVPSDAEWTQLTNYVSSQSQYVCDSNTTSSIAKALASTEWLDLSGSSIGIVVTCDVSYNPSTNNMTGFTVLPADGYSNDIGTCSIFCSATEYDGTKAYQRELIFNRTDVYRSYKNKGNRFSVRCVRD